MVEYKTAPLAQAMILAAGKGTRMGNLSDHTPKPLTEVAGVTLLDRIFTQLLDVNIRPVVINTHHLADKLEHHIAHYVANADAVISCEREKLLETGGGVKNAIPLLEPEFFVINSDVLWAETKGAQSTLERLRSAWNPSVMDVLLLLIPVESAFGYDGVGDFFYEGKKGEANTIRFRDNAKTSPFMYGGIQIVKASMYENMPDGSWSNREIFRNAANAGRLYGLPHAGLWAHVGTKAAIGAAEAHLRLFELG